jgi:transcriptional regulator with XRE-family HTH domain
MARKPLEQHEQWERERIGATIREIRESRGYKPDEFANLTGISRPYLMNIEAGRKPLTKVLLARFANVLNAKQIAIVHPGYFTEDAA